MHFDIRSVSFTFSDALLRELQFCPQHIDSFNGFPIRGVFSANSINNTNARNFAFGGCLATVDGKPVRGMFFPADVNMSSTYRELKAVFYVWKSYADRLKHQRVTVFVDNMGAFRTLMVGSSKPPLTYLVSVCLLASPYIRSG